ncbi:nuclear transport factor 2 family protein [Microvirga sp. STR05]|uniref:Nuclear transport factor 2 family protein n=1 Tax=Hymenobacter duratus TaxID=2771356 RepID=A0ABR8JNN1_9BACT|nr:nuclear transport factor 2 family protein [Hymenobacter duratus]MBD2717228.1 nuclear transport factor 2 family protein [Hymenobacter duratus]MBR7952147.1 nuclear transport factor 2 family protein [Microvirga sp. STR05]
MKNLFALAVLSATLPFAAATAQAQTTAAAGSADEVAVRAVLSKYQQAVQKLDTTGTHRLFTANSQVFESGGVEGSYRHYAEHHLAPELKEFSAFTFSDYKAAVQVDGPYAFATETYTYTINLKKDPKEKEAKAPIVRRGVATSVLRKNAAGQWQIMSTHTSARTPRVKK